MPRSTTRVLRHLRALAPKSLFPLLAAATLLAAPELVNAQSPAAPAPLPADVRASALYSFRSVTVAEGLQNPWNMAWLPNGDMLVTERPGRLRIVRGGKLLPDAVSGVPAVRAVAQGGLADVVVHPSFASNRLIYLSFSKPNADGTEATTAVVRGRLENDRLRDVEEVFDAVPFNPSANYGARMLLDGKGHLFLSSGDRIVPPSGDLQQHPAQDLAHLYGKILRLNEDGSVPADNPFVGRAGVRPEIWSYGHRNVQGMALNPTTGELWATEHGPQGGDELNLIRPGLNFGWPVITYGVNYEVGTEIGPRAREGMEQPVAFWVPSMAPSGLMYYTGDKFPLWRGNLFAGGMAAAYRHLSRIMLDGTRVTNREALLSGEMRIRDVRQGPDGYIYLATDNTRNPTAIVRLEPAD